GIEAVTLDMQVALRNHDARDVGLDTALIDAADHARSILVQAGKAEPRGFHTDRRRVPHRVHADRSLRALPAGGAHLHAGVYALGADEVHRHLVADLRPHFHRDDVGVAAGHRDARPLRVGDYRVGDAVRAPVSLIPADEELLEARLREMIGA